ncbi:hypothetical protein GCM10018963_30580 [Saccharothrix longispora]
MGRGILRVRLVPAGEALDGAPGTWSATARNGAITTDPKLSTRASLRQEAQRTLTSMSQRPLLL